MLARKKNVDFSENIKPRARVIIDNDFGGDPDGLFQLAHHLLSPSVEIRAIIGSHHYPNGFYGSPGTAAFACEKIRELLEVMDLNGNIPVFEGAKTSLTVVGKPVVSDAADAIVKEAMRTDTKLPLYVVCGAGLTNIASAYLMEPQIARKIILVWIGGPEYKGLALPPPGSKNPEYNLGIDIKAGQVIFNSSDFQIWQVPRDAYRQALYSYAELVLRLNKLNSLGDFLIRELESLMIRSNWSLGETYVLGDSPLVLLTALQSSWEKDASSSKSVYMNAPVISGDGLYTDVPGSRKIRVFTFPDTRLMFEDLVAKIALFK